MFRIRRFGAIMAVALFAGGAALTAPTAATAAPALTSESSSASSSAFPKFGGGPFLKTKDLTVEKGKWKWVKAWWKTSRDICDVEVTVEGEHVKIKYPDGEDSTSFSDGDSLDKGDTDYTAFRVRAKKEGDRELDVTISYTLEKHHDDDDDDDDDDDEDCEGKERSREFTIDLEVEDDD